MEKKRSGAWFWPCYRLAVWGKAYHLTTPLHKTSAQDVVSVHISSTQPPILIAVTLVFLPFHSDFCFSINLCSSWLWFLQWWRRKLLSLHRAPLVINREPAQGAASCQSPGFSLNLKAFGVRAVILLFVCSKKLENKWSSDPGQGFGQCGLVDTKDNPRNRGEATFNSRELTQNQL